MTNWYYPLIIVAILLQLRTSAGAQKTPDISGVWEEHAFGLNNNSPGKQGRKQDIPQTVEITVQNDSVIKGSVRWSNGADRYRQFHISGIYRPRDATVYFIEDTVMLHKMGGGLPTWVITILSCGSRTIQLYCWKGNGIL